MLGRKPIASPGVSTGCIPAPHGYGGDYSATPARAYTGSGFFHWRVPRPTTQTVYGKQL